MLELDGGWAWRAGPSFHSVFTLTLVLLHDHPIGARYIPRKFLDGTHFVFLIHNLLFDLCSDSQPKIPIRDSDMYPCTMSSHRNAPKIFLLDRDACKKANLQLRRKPLSMSTILS